jgi:hypothetical protein
LPRNSHLSKEEIDGDTAEKVRDGLAPHDGEPQLGPHER